MSPRDKVFYKTLAWSWVAAFHVCVVLVVWFSWRDAVWWRALLLSTTLPAVSAAFTFFVGISPTINCLTLAAFEYVRAHGRGEIGCEILDDNTPHFFCAGHTDDDDYVVDWLFEEGQWRRYVSWSDS